MSDIASRVVDEARGWCGTPYRHQAHLKGAGCDCLGLVLGIWRELYGYLPETVPAYTSDWAEAGSGDRLLAAACRHLEPCRNRVVDAGHLLVFRWRAHLPAKHLAIATSPTSMVHAQQGACVCETAISSWWRRHIAGVFRFPDA